MQEHRRQGVPGLQAPHDQHHREADLQAEDERPRGLGRPQVLTHPAGHALPLRLADAGPPQHDVAHVVADDPVDPRAPQLVVSGEEVDEGGDHHRHADRPAVAAPGDPVADVDRHRRQQERRRRPQQQQVVVQHLAPAAPQPGQHQVAQPGDGEGEPGVAPQHGGDRRQHAHDLDADDHLGGRHPVEPAEDRHRVDQRRWRVRELAVGAERDAQADQRRQPGVHDDQARRRLRPPQGFVDPAAQPGHASPASRSAGRHVWITSRSSITAHPPSAPRAAHGPGRCAARRSRARRRRPRPATPRIRPGAAPSRRRAGPPSATRRAGSAAAAPRRRRAGTTRPRPPPPAPTASASRPAPARTTANR